MWFFTVIALLAGAANPFQSAANAQLNREVGAPLWTGVVVYATGLVGMLLMLVLARESVPSGATIARVSPWSWTGGLISVVPTLAGLMLAQRMGSGVFTGLTVTASIVTSLLIDQLGVFGFRHQSASPMRLVGAGLMIAGTWLVTRR